MPRYLRYLQLHTATRRAIAGSRPGTRPPQPFVWSSHSRKLFLNGRKMQNLPLNKQKRSERLQRDAVCGEGELPWYLLPLPHVQATCFCRLLSLPFCPQPSRGWEAADLQLWKLPAPLPSSSTPCPIPTPRQDAPGIRTQAVEAPLQPGASV